MKIRFFKLDDFRQECIGRNVHRIRRDYVASTHAAESGNKDMGKVGLTGFKMVLTATDGEDLLRLEHRFYSCLSVFVDEEETKTKVEQLVEKIEKQLREDFPAEYRYTKNGDEYTFKFWLEKGVIEEV